MLDSPVAYWNISSLFPYSKLFFQSWPLRFHNSVEIIIAFQGSERVLQIMDKILSPLSEDAPSSYWSLQYWSVLGDWSYLPMGSKLKSQYQLIGGKIPQKLSLHQHPEEAIHYFLTPISVIALKSCGIPCPTPSTCRLWFWVIYGAKAAADTAQLTKVYGAELPECSVFTFSSSFLNFSTSFGNMAKGCLPFLFYALEKENLSLGKSGAALPVPKTAGHVFVMVLAVQRGHSPRLRQELFSPWYPFCAAVGARRSSSSPHGLCHTFYILEQYVFAQFSWNPEKCQTG